MKWGFVVEKRGFKKPALKLRILLFLKDESL
jgi:hypothetical protein